MVRHINQVVHLKNKLKKLKQKFWTPKDPEASKDKFMLFGCNESLYVKFINNEGEIHLKSYGDSKFAQDVVHSIRPLADKFCTQTSADSRPKQLLELTPCKSSPTSSGYVSSDANDQSPTNFKCIAEEKKSHASAMNVWGQDMTGALVYISPPEMITEKCAYCEMRPSINHLHATSDYSLVVDPGDTIPPLDDKAVQCQNCGSTGQLFHCSQMCSVLYCSSACQLKDRVYHRWCCKHKESLSCSGEEDDWDNDWCSWD